MTDYWNGFLAGTIVTTGAVLLVLIAGVIAQ